MQESESASQLHARIKEILNGLHLIGHRQENRDIIRYALNAFPRNTLWASIVDAYKISRNLSKINLDELFCELELHEQTNSQPAEKGIALTAGTTHDSDLEPDSDADDEELVNLVRRAIAKRRKKLTKIDVQRMMQPINKTKVICYGCNKKGHFKHECPNQKNDQPKRNKKKALQATWDETSDESDGEPPKNSSFLALMATGPNEETDEDSGNESSEEVGLFSNGSTEVTLDLVNSKFFRIISALDRKLIACENRIDELVKENNNLKKQQTNTNLELELNLKITTLELENQNLKDLLAKFTTRSKNLDLILGSLKGVYNKTGLGYNKGSTHKSFVSFSRPRKNQRKAWVPKAYITRQVGQNQIYVPKRDIHYLNPNYRIYDSGGGSKLVGTSKIKTALVGT